MIKKIVHRKINADKDFDNWFKEHAKTHGSELYSKRYSGVKFNIREPVLDIGGAEGSFLKHFQVGKATIMDAGGGKDLVGNYDFIETNITKKLPKIIIKPKTIFIMEALEHIKNPLYLMAQVYDILDNDGICYISVPYTKLDIERKGQKNPYNCHVCRWKKNELIDQMQKLGFKVRLIQSRRRFKGTAFYLPHCWLVLGLRKRLEH